MSPHPLQIVETLANLAAAILALFIVRRHRAHAAVAVLLCFGVCSAVAHEAAAPILAAAPRPLVGAARVVLHADQIRLLTWHLAVAAVVALEWNAPRLARTIAVAAVPLGVLACLVPRTRTAHAALYVLASSATLAVCAWAVLARNGSRWTVSQRTAIVLAGGELAALLTYVRGPWPGEAWTPAMAGAAVSFLAASAVQGWSLWTSGRSR